MTVLSTIRNTLMISLLSTYSLAHAELTIHPDTISHLQKLESLESPAVGNYQLVSTKYECSLKSGGLTPLNKSLTVELEILDRAYQTYELSMGLKSKTFSSIEDLVAYAKTAVADPNRGWGVSGRSNIKAIIDGKETILTTAGVIEQSGHFSWNATYYTGLIPGLPGFSKKANRHLNLFADDAGKLSMNLYQSSLAIVSKTDCSGEQITLVTQ